jgi:ribokinase
MAKIAVIGSSNTDMVVKAPRFPQPGETLLGGDFFMFPGGKGANQAVAAARLGANVSFLCAVGDDLFGRNALEHYKNEGIHPEGICILQEVPSGVALITINQAGENEIVVASGANGQLTEAHLQKNSALLHEAELLLTQLETPPECLRFLTEFSRRSGKRLILNPAPACVLPDDILSGLYLITPNQSEARLLTGVDVRNEESAREACNRFLEMGVRNVIITMGKKGAYFMNSENHYLAEAPEVTAQDTTAAGDIFNGALAVKLADHAPWPEALEYAGKAAALSVTRMGAQASAPYRHEI